MKKIVKFIFKIFENIFLFTLYCSQPDKYDGITYQEWLEKFK